MSNWITTPLHNGSPAGTTYSCNITGLLPNSKYEYRAYIVVCGVPYYGNTEQIVTLPLILSIPTVDTGSVGSITYNSMQIVDNKIIDKGNLNVCEYGILYTQNSSMRINLAYENYPTYVCKASFSCDISVNAPYFTGITGNVHSLASNTMTYYRAYAINSCGCGYGATKCVLTDQLPVTLITVSLDKTCQTSTNSSTGVVTINPALMNGQCVNIGMSMINHLNVSGNSKTNIYCKPNGSSTYSSIYNCTSLYGAVSNGRALCKTIPINCGDMICWSHSTCGGTGSYNVIQLNTINSYSSDILPSISAQSYCDIVFKDANFNC